MLHILLLILKIIGIILAVIIGILLMGVLLLLFVPVKYRIKAEGSLYNKDSLHAEIKITWLFHIVNVIFAYPKAAYIRIRLLYFTIFNSSKPLKEKKKRKPKKEKKTEKRIEPVEKSKEIHKEIIPRKMQTQEPADTTQKEVLQSKSQKDQKTAQTIKEETQKQNLWQKLIQLIGKIRYTIKGFYDKIKKIIKNIEFYIEVLQSDVFKRAFKVSKKQLFRIIKSIRPKKCDIRLLLGTGDPAGTGQILAVYGIAYPFLGNNVSIQADFENKIAEGSLYIKGSITVFTLIIAAFTIYRDRNIRQLLKLLKREES